MPTQTTQNPRTEAARKKPRKGVPKRPGAIPAGWRGPKIGLAGAAPRGAPGSARVAGLGVSDLYHAAWA